MNIYNYHPATKVFVGESVADESPLEEGVFLVPANATTIAPPAIPADSVAVFENGGWRIAAIEKPPTPEPEKQISEQEKTNAKARRYLATTDWYVIRKMETGVEIPEDISAARVAARLSIVE